MMARALRLPHVEHLADEPQLATLALLENAANVAILALAAQYPELNFNDDPQRDAELRATLDIVDLSRALDCTIHRYRRELRKARERKQNRLPF